MSQSVVSLSNVLEGKGEGGRTYESEWTSHPRERAARQMDDPGQPPVSRTSSTQAQREGALTDESVAADDEQALRGGHGNGREMGAGEGDGEGRWGSARLRPTMGGDQAVSFSCRAWGKSAGC